MHVLYDRTYIHNIHKHFVWFKGENKPCKEVTKLLYMLCVHRFHDFLQRGVMGYLEETFWKDTGLVVKLLLLFQRRMLKLPIFSLYKLARATMLRCNVYGLWGYICFALLYSPFNRSALTEIMKEAHFSIEKHFIAMLCTFSFIYLDIPTSVQVTTSFVCSVYSLLSHPYYLTYYTIFPRWW